MTTEKDLLRAKRLLAKSELRRVELEHLIDTGQAFQRRILADVEDSKAMLQKLYDQLHEEQKRTDHLLTFISNRTINNRAMIEAVYPVLQRRKADGSASERLIQDIIATVADGYSFPTNLDSDPPIGGNAPETEQQMMWRALEENWSIETLQNTLTAYATRRQA